MITIRLVGAITFEYRYYIGFNIIIMFSYSLYKFESTRIPLLGVSTPIVPIYLLYSLVYSIFIFIL